MVWRSSVVSSPGAGYDNDDDDAGGELSMLCGGR